MNWLNSILVMIGGGCGAVFRVLGDGFIMGHAANHIGGGFPVGILGVNILGCFAMGVLQGLLKRCAHPCACAYALLGTGFLGGFTTFSTFAVDSARLWLNGAPVLAVINVAATATLCLLAVIGGWYLTAPRTQTA